MEKECDRIALSPVQRVELVDVLPAANLSVALPVTCFAVHQAGGGESSSSELTSYLVQQRAPFRVLVAFDAPQTITTLERFADSLWGSYAWPRAKNRFSLWQRVQAWLAEPATREIGQRFSKHFFPGGDQDDDERPISRPPGCAPSLPPFRAPLAIRS